MTSLVYCINCGIVRLSFDGNPTTGTCSGCKSVDIRILDLSKFTNNNTNNHPEAEPSTLDFNHGSTV